MIQFSSTIQTLSSYVLGEPIRIEIVLRNESDAAVWVLGWQTPMEGLLADFLRIRHNGRELEYDGPLVTRLRPGASSYILFQPGEARTNSIDLHAAYPILEPGEYEIKLDLIILDACYDLGAKLPRHTVQHEISVQSDIANLRVATGQAPLVTEGTRWRAADQPPQAGLPPYPPNPQLPQFVPTNMDSDAMATITAAHNGAYQMIVAALPYLTGGGPTYYQYFGAWSPTRFQVVVTNFNAMATAMATKTFTYYSPPTTPAICKTSLFGSNIMAYTYWGSSSIFICDYFFSWWNFASDCAFTLVHEISHAVVKSNDEGYGMSAAFRLAQRHPDKAVYAAENIALFAANCDSEWSPQGNGFWTTPIRWSDTASARPAAAASSTQLMLVYKGTGSGNNKLYYKTSPLPLTSWANTQSIGGCYTTTGPGCAFFGNAFYVVYPDGNGLQYIYYNPTNESWSSPALINSVNPTVSPALVAFAGGTPSSSLICVYSDPNSDYLYSITGTPATPSGPINWGTPVPIGASVGSLEPALAVFGDRLYCFWGILSNAGISYIWTDKPPANNDWKVQKYVPQFAIKTGIGVAAWNPGTATLVCLLNPSDDWLGLRNQVQSVTFDGKEFSVPVQLNSFLTNFQLAVVGAGNIAYAFYVNTGSMVMWSNTFQPSA